MYLHLTEKKKNPILVCVLQWIVAPYSLIIRIFSIWMIYFNPLTFLICYLLYSLVLASFPIRELSACSSRLCVGSLCVFRHALIG